MIIKLYVYPTDHMGRVWLSEAASITGQPDGWAEATPDPGTPQTDLELLSQALRWASEGQAVRVEFN